MTRTFSGHFYYQDNEGNEYARSVLLTFHENGSTIIATGMPGEEMKDEVVYAIGKESLNVRRRFALQLGLPADHLIEDAADQSHAL